MDYSRTQKAARRHTYHPRSFGSAHYEDRLEWEPDDNTVKRSTYDERRPNRRPRMRFDESDSLHPGRIARDSLGIFSRAIRIARIPLSLFLCLFALLYLYKWTLIITEPLLVRTTKTICMLPLVGGSKFCIPPPAPTADPYFEKALKMDVELASIQKMASDTAALPYQLIVGQSDFKDMLFSLMAADLPSQDRIMPLIKELNHILEEVTDTMQDALSMSNALIDNTVITLTGASAELELIEDRESSILAPVSRAVGFHSTSKNELAVVFKGLAEKLDKQSDSVILKYQKLRGYLSDLKDLLDTIALKMKQEGQIVDKKKLGEFSYWKWLLREHRDKMANFDDQMRVCARFYNFTLTAGNVVTTTQMSLHDYRGKIKNMQSELKEATLYFDTRGVSLKLTLAKIAASVAYLEEARISSKAQQRARVEAFDNEMASKQVLQIEQ